MENFTLNIEQRVLSGSSVSRRIRKEGKVPTAIYYPNGTSKLGSVSNKDFTRIAEKMRFTDVISLKSSDSGLNDVRVLVKEVSKEPVSGKLEHIDFQALEAGHKVRVKIPLFLEGIPSGVKLEGGILTKTAQSLTVLCDPSKIPHDIHVDVSALNVGDSIEAGDIKLSEGVELKSKSHETIASVVESRETRLQAVTEADASATTTEAMTAPAAGAKKEDQKKDAGKADAGKAKK